MALEFQNPRPQANTINQEEYKKPGYPSRLDKNTATCWVKRELEGQGHKTQRSVGPCGGCCETPHMSPSGLTLGPPASGSAAVTALTGIPPQELQEAVLPETDYAPTP